MTDLFKKLYDEHETKQMPMQVLPLETSTRDFFQRVVFAVTNSIHTKSK